MKKLKAVILVSLSLDDLKYISQTNNSIANPTNLAVWPRRRRGLCCSNKLLSYLNIMNIAIIVYQIFQNYIHNIKLHRGSLWSFMVVGWFVKYSLYSLSLHSPHHLLLLSWHFFTKVFPAFLHISSSWSQLHSALHDSPQV